QVRIAGFADFVGFRTSKDAQRVAKLLHVAGAVAPCAADYQTSPNRAWGGFRPLTANGRPLLGPTSVTGLYLNTGHGTLGWTLACASGEEVAQAVSGQPAASQLAA
ncbi:MAG: FAD-dependent oxidoreductase, partial [Gammaproteobacteria bacterium]|nr:FAD-dependent oxidoreductase [Gammaproteobacteria bacterium]